MALFNFASHLSGDASEWNVPKGSVTVQADDHNGVEAYILQVNEGATTTVIEPNNDLGDITTGSAHYMTLGMYVRFDNFAINKDFLVIFDAGATSASYHCKVGVGTSGEIRLINAAGSVSTSSDTMTAGVWYLVELELDIGNFIAGNASVYVDRKQWAVKSNSDFYVSGTTTNYQFDGFGTGGSSNNYDLASAYCFEDASSQPARLGHFYCLGYGYDEATATPNITGDALDAGNWDDANEIPASDSAQASYNNTHSGVVECSYSAGSRTPGPKGDSRVGNIHGAAWTFRLSRAGGFGSTGLYVKYGAGDGSDGTAETTNYSSTNTTPLAHIIVEEGANVPTRAEYFQYGFRNGGTLQAHLEDMWCNLLCTRFEDVRAGQGPGAYRGGVYGTTD